MDSLLFTKISNFTTQSGTHFDNIPLSYQMFGKPLGQHPVVLVIHAMTGNSEVGGDNGWWSEIVGKGKAIDTSKYSILAFNIPGNGFDGYFIDDIKAFLPYDIAKIFKLGLEQIGISKIDLAIGGSIGGILTWELAVNFPELIGTIVPIATDWKATDWMIANTYVQDILLQHPQNALYNARIHAMNFYRTPISYKTKFGRKINQKNNVTNIESWLNHHGQKLVDRFDVRAYKLMNHLVKSNDITRGLKPFDELMQKLNAKVHMIAIDSDLFFVKEENIETLKHLRKLNKQVTYSEVKSIHGHDAFLIEFDQLTKILTPILNQL